MVSNKDINFRDRAARVQRVRFFQYTIDLAIEYGVPNTNIVAALVVLNIFQTLKFLTVGLIVTVFATMLIDSSI